MKNKLLKTLLLVIVLLVVCVYAIPREPFFASTSPGTLVQLVSSHVPTQADVDYYTKVYPKVVRREITDMTEL